MIHVTTDRKTRARRRLTTVVTTVAAAGLVWAAGTAILGHGLVVPQTGGRPPMTVTLPMVLFVSALSSLLGWGLLAVLERASRRGTRIWVGIAVAVLLVSFLPLAAPGLAPGTRVVLALLHLVVGVLLIPGMNHTSPARAHAADYDSRLQASPAR